MANYFEKEKSKALALGYIQFNPISGRKCFIPYFEEYKKLQKEINNVFWEEYKKEKALNSESFINYYKPKVREYFMKKGDIERMSLNYPIQGSSADITKLACIYFLEFLQEKNLLFKVLMANVVHDEIIVECSKELVQEISLKLQECMERAGNVFCKVVKLKAEPCITKNWKH